MKIIRMAAGIYAANCYIIYSTNTLDGVIVDPGGDVDDIFNILDENKIKITSIILTHGHGDHIGGLIDLNKRLKVDIMIHQDDREMLVNKNINLSSIMPMESVEVEPNRFLKDGDKIGFGDREILVIHTPGHTKGGICLKIEDNILTGDTLFAGSIGRTDLYGGDFNSIINSIKEKIIIYPDDTNIFPGHGAPTTIGMEKIQNPYLK